jgi:hypothetical protein
MTNEELLVLDTLIYQSSFSPSIQNQTVGQILNNIDPSKIPQDDPNGSQEDVERIIDLAKSDPEICRLQVTAYKAGSSDNSIPDYTGNNMMILQDPDNGKKYGIFAGTAGPLQLPLTGEWPYDLAGAFAPDPSNKVNMQQWFNANVAPGDNITVSGHSDGGNDSMYLTMLDGDNDRIGRCLSFDGQGFDAMFPSMDGYNSDNADKIYEINQYFDPVHAFLNAPCSPDHIMTIFGAYGSISHSIMELYNHSDSGDVEFGFGTEVPFESPYTEAIRLVTGGADTYALAIDALLEPSTVIAELGIAGIDTAADLFITNWFHNTSPFKVRDFTAATEEHLADLAAQASQTLPVIGSLTDWAGDHSAFIALWEDVCNDLGFVDAYKEYVLDANNVSVEKLHQIFDDVREIDRNYPAEHFNAANEAIADLNRTIESICDGMLGDIGGTTAIGTAQQ